MGCNSSSAASAAEQHRHAGEQSQGLEDIEQQMDELLAQATVPSGAGTSSDIQELEERQLAEASALSVDQVQVSEQPSNSDEFQTTI
mmetsp:Transcript_39385/g.65056  ORF Transcript_39385/g.65056 Transcript_39385/m.65056 type:complete len:87 (-) Transcript_39385:333-593(-)